MRDDIDAVFQVDGAEIIPSRYASGPWDPTMQHGSAPTALVTWIAENIPTPAPMHIARVTMDLLRPVPVAPLTYETEIIRQGRKIQLCAVRLLAQGVLVAKATVLKIRSLPEPFDLPATVVNEPLDLPLPDTVDDDTSAQSTSGFITGMSMRAVKGAFGKAGSGGIWFRVNRPIVAGQPVSQVVRAVVASDFSNGVSAMLSSRKWTFLNADLSVFLSRPPVGEWILVHADSSISAAGHGSAMSRLADVTGYFGRAVQSLVIEKRPD